MSHYTLFGPNTDSSYDLSGSLNVAIEPEQIQVPVATPDGTLNLYTVSRGPRGPVGPSDSDPTTWYGEGPPTTIIGSSPGDYYTDLLTGTIYKLGD